MVFKLIRAGRKLADLKKGLESSIELEKYMEKRKNIGNRHPLHEDIEILNKYIDYIRFSRPASLAYDAPPLEKEEDEHDILPKRGKTTLPIAYVQDVLLYPERWSGHHVIIDGELEHVNTNRKGERWHRFKDHTGTVIAMSRHEIKGNKGTLFGVARQTPAGKQLFLEIKNFHPSES
ncbi:MAG: hypothetical protein JSV63_02785 [Candidatus Aenigmatarchaeota archaeon]|nr:MAG: hypothetical protein JSV63_02785 [Candidatus Aenigmarchaeota archaeon]